MNREDVNKFLRKEAEELGKKIDNIEIKMTKILNKNGITDLDKLQKMNFDRKILQAQQFKLYEMIGRTDEIEESK